MTVPKRMTLTNVEYIDAARALWVKGQRSRIVFRKTFKDGMGLKLWWIFRFDEMFPNLGIIAKCEQYPAVFNRLDYLKFMRLHNEMANRVKSLML